MKTQDFDTLNIGPDDDDINDPANQENYPETDIDGGDELDTEDTEDEDDDLADTEDTNDNLGDDDDINENEEDDLSDRSANDVDGNGGYPDDKGTINPGVI
ncbi:MAG TPA: hypothetical protein VIM89_06575 [Mucilaginibacter sp.]